jgi:hypothetical protein
MMTDDRLPLAELLQKAGEGDFLRTVAEAVLQLLMEADVEGLIGAARHERSAERLTWRNGYRKRTRDTRLGQRSLRAIVGPKASTHRRMLSQVTAMPRSARSSSTSRKLSVKRRYIQTARWMMSRGNR